MKKCFAVFAVLAFVCLSSMAFAADVSVGGSIDLRMRDFRDLDMNKNAFDGQVDTQERVRLDVNAKAGDAKAKVTIENDWDTMGRYEAVQGTTNVVTGVSGTVVSTGKASRLGVREAWLLTPIPGTPVYLKAGHMFLQLGSGWVVRSNKYGSDALVAFADFGGLHLGFVDAKIAEGNTAQADDTDAYVLVAVNKFSDDITAGVDLTFLKDRGNNLGFAGAGGRAAGTVDAQNIGLNFKGKMGPMNLMAEADFQMGKIDIANPSATDPKLKGNQIIVQGSVPMDPVTVNFTVGRGTGEKAGSNDVDAIVTFLDADPHYTFLYEYKIPGPCGASTGFCNTTAINAGAMFAATKNLSVGADLWILQATEKVADVTSATGATTNELGTELDVKVNWKLADGVSWNWVLGYLDAGKGLGKDPATGAQGVLSMKF